MLKHLLNKFFLSTRYIIKAALAFTLFALLITMTGCGKRKPPLPPIEKTTQRVELEGFQRGRRIILSWKMPARNAPDGSVLNINRADIYRLVEYSNSSLTLTEEEFASRSTLISTVPISDKDFALQKISYTDLLEFAGQPVRLRYAVRFVNSSGQKAAFSNFFLIEPSAKVANNPGSLTAKTTEEAIFLEWKAPQTNADGSTPVNFLGYNLYRSNSENEPGKLLNEISISATSYLDKSFEFNKEYFYFVRTISLGNDGESIESLESNIVKILPQDTFAPSAPGAITIAAAPGILSIFFATNPEKDIAGYRLYRSTDRNLRKSEWSLLTNDLLTTNTFQDSKVESGKTYFYYLVAVDKAGNISEPSEVVSETVL
jgi:predicted small lipoprotein YifL